MISTFSQFIFLRSNHFDEESTSWKDLEKRRKRRRFFHEIQPIIYKLGVSSVSLAYARVCEDWGPRDPKRLISEQFEKYVWTLLGWAMPL